MSWKGVRKTISRFPHQFKTRNGGDDVTRDKEYLELEAQYKQFVKYSDELFSETVAYRDSLLGILDHQLQCANYLADIYNMSDEPSAEIMNLPPATKQALEDYATAMTYCREETTSLLDELDARVAKPFDQYQMIVKEIEKTIMKREHKLVDYDRHRVSYTKFSAIPEPSPSEERNMFKLQAQFDNAAHDYEYFNNMLKNDLAIFLDLSSEFIQPIVDRFFDLQYRIIGGFYGRIYEVMQHNQSFLPTLDMSIDKGFMQRLSQRNTREEIENSELLKKGLKSWERTTTLINNTTKPSPFKTTSPQDNESSENHSPMQGCHTVNRTLSSNASSSNSFSFNNNERLLYSNSNSQSRIDHISYRSNNEQQKAPSYPSTPPPLLPKPSLSPAVSYYAQSATTTSSPPPLAKKPLMVPRSSFTNKVQNADNNSNNNTPPPIRRPTASPIISNSYKSVNQQQQNQSDMNKLGYTVGGVGRNFSSSSLNSNSSPIMTPSSTPSISPAVVELRTSSYKKSAPPLSRSPFADQQPQEVIKKKRTPPPPPPSRGSYKKEYVEALYDLNASQDGDLSFAFGDRIEVIEKSNKSDDWWKGRIGNQVGMFPANYVRQM